MRSATSFEALCLVAEATMKLWKRGPTARSGSTAATTSNPTWRGAAHQMSNLLDSSPAALVIVAVDQTREDMELTVSQATATIITESTTADPDPDFMRAIDGSNASG
jgi:hypothetical protein